MAASESRHREPAEFIGLAEENGLILPLGEYVTLAACAQSSAWRAARLPVLPIAINVSSHQFRHGHVADTLARIADKTACDLRDVAVEITESVTMANVERNIGTLSKLKAMGVKLAIDDFGTGYSSLCYLDRFPLDELKIDRSFMAPIRTAADRSPIVTAIIAMAHSLGLRVVAEGVETAQQLAFLEAQQCDEYQGVPYPGPCRPPISQRAS